MSFTKIGFIVIWSVEINIKENIGIHKGENNGRYNSVRINCTNCGKEFVVPMYKTKQVNRFGDTHNFCSKECYWEYKKKYYVGEKAVMHNYHFSKEQINKMRENTVKMYSLGKFPTKNTAPHLKINELLDKLNIKYINEKNYKYYSIDIYLPDFNLAIEIMGDYFHANPLKYKKEELNSMQLKNIRRDKAKHTYMKKYHNINILYLWEYDINHNLKLCEYLILKYINSKGIMEEYNSYKYN